MQRLFVYGTLAPGQPNEHILAPLKGGWESASVKGILYEKGWGAAMGYPGLVLDDTGDTIKGQIFASDDLDQHWARLDEFEGEEYERRETTVLLEDGSSVAAFVYAIKGSP